MQDMERLARWIKEGDAEQTVALLTERPELLGVTVDEVPLVMLALYYGQDELAHRIASLNPDLTLFELAALGHDAELAKRVRPTLVDSLSPDGFTLLGYASYFGRTQCIEVLIKAGANPNLGSRNAFNVMPLHSALAANNIAIARELIRAGANVNSVAGQGWTPLHYAAASGNEPLAKILLAAGADPHAKRLDGKTPADVALEKGHTRLASLCVEAGELAPDKQIIGFG